MAGEFRYSQEVGMKKQVSTQEEWAPAKGQAKNTERNCMQEYGVWTSDAVTCDVESFLFHF